MSPGKVQGKMRRLELLPTKSVINREQLGFPLISPHFLGLMGHTHIYIYKYI